MTKLTIEEVAKVVVHINSMMDPLGLDDEFTTSYADEIADQFSEKPWTAELQAAIISETERQLVELEE